MFHRTKLQAAPTELEKVSAVTGDGEHGGHGGHGGLGGHGGHGGHAHTKVVNEQDDGTCRYF